MYVTSQKIENQFDIDRESIRLKLNKKYHYDERIEDGRTVLRCRNLKFIEVIDTPEDRVRYAGVVRDYIKYINENYRCNVDLDCVDMETVFNEDILQEDKLPMFFLYNYEDRLLGVVGYRSVLNFNFNKNEIDKSDVVSFQEFSSRLATWKDSNAGRSIVSYGSVSFFVMYLYAINNNKRICCKSFPNIRDLMFHYSRIVDQYFYFSLPYRLFSDDYTFNFDLFMDEKPTDEKISIAKSSLHMS